MTTLTQIESINELVAGLRLEKRFAESREILIEALSRRDELGPDEIINLTHLLGIIEYDEGRFVAALGILSKVLPLVEVCQSPLLKGKYHNTLAAIYLELKDFDQAIIEFTAASIYYEEANDVRRRSDTKNNLACVLVKVGNYEDAHLHLDHALDGCDDPDLVAQINDTRARILLGEAKPYEALGYAYQSIRHFGQSDKSKLLEISNATLRMISTFIEEAEPAKRALIEANGDVEKAAHLLGMKCRQNLEYYLRKYPHLKAFRTPAKQPRGPQAKRR